MITAVTSSIRTSWKGNADGTYRCLETIWLAHGIPLSYYVDSHSIFRFVERRDSVWKKQYLKTDEVDQQWKRIMNECRVKVIYALSAQAKGKIERPYRWLQDRVVRTCARDH
jgi:L-rhamnose mutarotase